MGINTFTRMVEGISIVGETHIPDGPGPHPVVVICHGIPSGRPNEGDPGYRPLAHRLAKSGFLAVLFNFRGCGLSGGNIDLAGWCRDVTAILDMLWERDDADRGRVSLLGFSGGAAVSAVVSAGDARVSYVGLMACPAEFSFLFKEDELDAMIAKAREIGSIRDAGFPEDSEAWLHGLYSVKAEDYIGGIAPRPVLIVHGTADEVVPVEHAQRLFACAGEPKELMLLEGVSHRLRQVPAALDAACVWLGRMNKIEEDR